MIQLELSEEMQAFVDRQVKEGEFADAAEYLARLIRTEQKRLAKQRLERSLLDALNEAGGDLEQGSAFWKS